MTSLVQFFLPNNKNVVKNQLDSAELPFQSHVAINLNY
jgi:hypothetical protein